MRSSSYYIHRIDKSPRLCSLKLVVDKEKNKVVFAESNKDFVDYIFSFLTLPMGTIIRLLDKNSGVECMDKLYKSVEDLDTPYLQTKACKQMLLQPRHASEIRCESLMRDICDNIHPREIYRCDNTDCFTKTHCAYSSVRGARCPCGRSMETALVTTKPGVDTGNDGGFVDGVFVKGDAKFTISDDLHITPIKPGFTFSLFRNLGIDDTDALEERTVTVSKCKMLSLLKRMLLSETPLTDVFLRYLEYTSNVDGSEREEFKHLDTSLPKVGDGSKKIALKVIEDGSSGKVAYVEASEDFVDLLFSFLTFPLGSVVKLLNKRSSLGCADNLYGCIEILSSLEGSLVKSQECKDMLLDPKLSSHFGCGNQILRIHDELTTTTSLLNCDYCFRRNISPVDCSLCCGVAKVTIINPKLPTPGTARGGGFVKRPMKFMVTNQMIVTPLSPSMGLHAIKELKVPITSLVERDISCGETEVLNLLQNCLVSRLALNKVFSTKS